MNTQQPEALRLTEIARYCFRSEGMSDPPEQFESPTGDMVDYFDHVEIEKELLARITELESQLAQRFDAADMATAAAQGFRDGVASLTARAADRAIEGCPELNMGNYDEVDVERLNDWAIRANDEIDRIHALAAGQAAAAQAVAEPADTVVLNAAMRAIQQAIELIGAPTDERMRAVRRVLRGAVIVAEDAGKVAPLPSTAYAALPESFLEIPDVQDESGINAYYSLEAVLECIDAALASHGQAPAGATEPTEQQILEAAFAPAQPAVEASRFGSPELQAMIIARCVEKDQADSVLDDAAPAYRLLQRGRDTIQADDEFLREDGVTWRKDPSGIFVGIIYEGNILLPARRAIDAARKQGEKQ